MGVVSRLFRSDRDQYDYHGSGLATRGKNLGFMDDPRFIEAYNWSVSYEFDGKRYQWRSLDLRWRIYMCIWAAKHALSLEGDFVECGVNTAMFSGATAEYLDFAKQPRRFYLFDTYEGIPETEGLTEIEQRRRQKLNKNAYFNSFSYVKEKMKAFKNVHLVKGVLPDALSEIVGTKIAYLSTDLNNAPAEKAVIERLWDQLTPGAITVIEGYGLIGFEPSYEAWNEFAGSKGQMIATLPTGQGLLIKA
jgi:O-methyltransferase